MISADEVCKLSDNDLFKLMKQAGIEVGPITSTTRSVYQKKYIKHLKEKRVPVARVTLERIDKPANKTTASKTANTQTKIHDDEDEDLIVMHEETNKSLHNPEENSRARHVHYEERASKPAIFKQKPKFEFKLLKDPEIYDSSLNDTYETHMFKSNIERGVKQTQQYNSNYYNYRNYDDTIMEQTNRVTNRKPFFQQTLASKPAKSNSPLESAPFRGYNDFGYQGGESSLYNQQPPPFPTQYAQTKAVGNAGKQNSWASSICSNIKYWLMIAFVIFLVYTFLSYLQSFNDENPIVD